MTGGGIKNGINWWNRIFIIANVISSSIFLGSTILATFVTWKLIHPYFYNGNDLLLYVHRSLVVVLFTNVIGHFTFCILIDTSTRGHVPGTSHCTLCHMPRPPRSHHCKICGLCILRRDHHCFFMTTCIGEKNRKYFIMFCLNMTFGAFYCVILTIKYLVAVYALKFYGPQTFFTLLFGFTVSIFKGAIPSIELLMLIYLLYVSLNMGLFSCGLFVWQIMISASGQTTYESWSGIQPPKKHRKLSSYQHLTCLMGTGGILALFLPIPFHYLFLCKDKQLNMNNKIKK